MKNAKLQKSLYIVGIGIGIILVVAFLTSQIIYPILLGRPGVVEVPDVTGISLTQAKRVLHEKRLHVVVSDSVWSEETKVEYVLEQQPEPGSDLKHDHAVYLVISRGSREVRVPDVIGSQYHRAYIQLRSSGLKAVIADSLYSDQYPANAVVRCSPAVGTKVNKQSSVRLFLSRGTEPVAPVAEEEVFPF